MKAKEIMTKLKITRPTLCNYVKKGYIKAHKLPNGQYDYDDSSIDVFRTGNVSDSSLTGEEDILIDCIKNSINIFNTLRAYQILPAQALPHLKMLEENYNKLSK